MVSSLKVTVLVVGSKHSSNSVRLTEISQTDGTPARLLDDAGEIRPEWFDGVETVLVTAGASAPDDLVEGVLDHLKTHHGGEVEVSSLFEEDTKFPLPVQLRIMKHETA